MRLGIFKSLKTCQRKIKTVALLSTITSFFFFFVDSHFSVCLQRVFGDEREIKILPVKAANHTDASW